MKKLDKAGLSSWLLIILTREPRRRTSWGEGSSNVVGIKGSIMLISLLILYIEPICHKHTNSESFIDSKAESQPDHLGRYR
jgi:hypothetical protein